MASYSDPITNAAVYEDMVYYPSEETLKYRVEAPLGNVLLRGEVSERPDGTPAQLYVNRICEPFLSNTIDPTQTGLTQHTGACQTFYFIDEKDESIKATYTALRMYSGYYSLETGTGGNFVPRDRILSDPIRPNVSKEMYLPFSFFSQNGSGWTPTPTCNYLYFDDYTGSTCDITVGPSAQTLTFYVHTNIDYSQTQFGCLIHNHRPATFVVWAYYENPDWLLVQYKDNYPDQMGPNVGNHTVYDHTDENPPYIQYKVNQNTSGREKHYKERFSIRCGDELVLIYTLNITQTA